MHHCLDEWQLSRDAYYSTISDSDLDDHVREIRIRQNPIIGEVMLMAALKVHNVWVQRTRLQASIHRVDSHTTVLRRRGIYMYKLKESALNGWSKQLMVHRWESQDDLAENDHSCTIVYLQCASNNTAATALRAFRTAVEQFGLPQKVRSDQGRENTEVGRFICEAHEDTVKPPLSGQYGTQGCP